MEFLFKVTLFCCLFAIGWYFGRRNEQQHLAQLVKAEARLKHIRLGTLRFETRDQPGRLIMSSVVLSHDYFKMVWAQIHSFFGGNLTTYESLLERARREAIIRLKQQAQRLGSDEILAVRLSHSELGEQGGTVEVIAYGTAIFSVLAADHSPAYSAWPPVPDQGQTK